MNKSKLAYLFYELSSTQRTALRKFVASPYHNKRKDVQQLLQYLENIEHRLDERLEKEKVFAHLFPNQSYSKENDHQVRYVMSFLLKLIETFLLIEESISNPIQNEITLSRIYQKMHLSKPFYQHLKQARDLNEAIGQKDFNYYRYLFEIEEEAFYFTAYSERTAPKNLQALSDTLDKHYIAAKLKQACSLRSHQMVSKSEYDVGFLNYLLVYVAATPHLLQEDSIALYYFFYQATSKNDGELFFQKYKDRLIAIGNCFNEEEMRLLYGYAVNYCIRKANLQSEGFENYFSIMFELYQEGLRHGFLLVDDVMSPFTFKNIISTALWHKAFDWTNSFINKYKKYLPAAHRATYLNFALSKLFFEQKQYGAALKHLQKMEYNDIFLNLNAKVMQLKIYYELKEYDALDSFLTSFRTYVNRKKQSGDLRSYHQGNFLNIIRFTQKLLTYNPFSKKEKQQLREEIEAEAVLTERKWLLQQL